MKRYGGLVVGLVILAVMINPLWSWMRQLHHVAVNNLSEGWTNTPAGFTTVVSTEELHQAEAIVLSMPHIVACHLTMDAAGHVSAVVETSNSQVSVDSVRHYVQAALTVTMGEAPAIRLTVHPVRQVKG